MYPQSRLLEGSPVTELYDEAAIARYRGFVVSYAKEVSEAGHKLWTGLLGETAGSTQRNGVGRHARRRKK